MRKWGILGSLLIAALGAAGVWLFVGRGAVGGPQSPVVFPTPRSTEVLLTVNGEPILAWNIAFFEANGISRAEALDYAIDGVVGRQAAQRLGLDATDGEVKECFRDTEADWAKMSEEAWLEAEALFMAQGLPTENIEDDPRWVAYCRELATGFNLRRFLSTRAAVARLTGVSPDSISDPTELEAAQAGLDPQAVANEIRMMSRPVQRRPGTPPPESESERFMRQERAKAEIVPNSVGMCTITELTVTCVGGP